MQFCLLADSLPIIFCLITCLYQGERLDHRSCEALEVVLKSLHFDFINLQAAQLEENVSFMSKTYFPHLRLPIPIQFHIQAFLCIRLEAIFFFPKELHNIPCQIWGLAFFIFFLLYFFFLFQGASSLLDMILYYESTTHLDISDNSSMGTSGWRALAHLIKQVSWRSGIVIFTCRPSPGDNGHCRKWVCCTLHGLKMRGRANRMREYSLLRTYSIKTHHNTHILHYCRNMDSISRHNWLAVRWETIGLVSDVTADWL